jgi:hypothetical protein
MSASETAETTSTSRCVGGGALFVDALDVRSFDELKLSGVDCPLAGFEQVHG